MSLHGQVSTFHSAIQPLRPARPVVTLRRTGTGSRSWLLCGWLMALLLQPSAANAEETDAAQPAVAAPIAAAEGERFFEDRVRPILAEHCQGCHGADKQHGGLRLDSWTSLSETSDSAPVVIAGDADASLLIRAVRREEGLAMPPDAELTAEQIETLSHWVRLGAPWPQGEPIPSEEAAKRALAHWAFQPVVRPELPAVRDDAWVRTPVDQFVLAALEAQQLAPSPAADRRTLIRRASYLVTGLPPTQEAIDRFVASQEPDAYPKLVEELLGSAQFGEQWARMWLDVARYSDSKGYVYAREHRFWTHAWAYRDWVVDSFNRDRPYNEFLLLQLAADQVAESPKDLAAMGFLTLGRRFLGVRPDVIDDRIDAVSRGMMGLTVACARCHDHKYDPIPTADYYSLYGVFDSCLENERSIGDPSQLDAAYVEELQRRQQALAKRIAEIRKDTSDRARERVGDYLAAQFELEKYPGEAFNQLFSKNDLLPTIVHRWVDYLREAERREDPVFVAWHQLAPLAELPSDQFAERAAAIVAGWSQAPNQHNPLIAAAFAQQIPSTPAELAGIYAGVFAEVRRRVAENAANTASSANGQPSAELADPAAEAIRRALYDPNSACEIPDESIVELEYLMDIEGTTELWKLQSEVDRWVIDSAASEPRARILVDRPVPSEPRIFRRGNALRKEGVVPRQFLGLLSDEPRQPFQIGSGRLELARGIIDPSNPLTARVIVNRIWGHYFGRPLVDTPSDFGLRAATPSHPELLDWLADRLVAEGWSLKQVHRQILLSAAFQQSASGPEDPAVRSRAEQTDPANRWLWHWQPRRLTLEEMRDSLIAVTGKLDLAVGGKPIASLWNPPFSDRRTLYGTVDRQFLPGLMRVFDFANPDLHIPQRSETTAPQQALFFLNHPLVLNRTHQLAETLKQRHPGEDSTAIGERATALFRAVLFRDPSPAELAEAVEFVNLAIAEAVAPTAPKNREWAYGFGSWDEAAGRIQGFTALPHFTGEAWQGGPQFPDGQLGWVKLDATGGHPGNDRAHAAIRRWTAPRDLRIEIRSTFNHEPPQGDGVRAAIVSSHGTPGTLASAQVHMAAKPLDVAALDVVAGQTIDFLVDIGDGLSYDQFLWQIRILSQDAGGEPIVWDASQDFEGVSSERLDPWEQLTQVLLCTNEFLFIP